MKQEVNKLFELAKEFYRQDELTTIFNLNCEDDSCAEIMNKKSEEYEQLGKDWTHNQKVDYVNKYLSYILKKLSETPSTTIDDKHDLPF